MIELGNPKLKSFKATFIRRVIVDDARVSVHRDIVPQTEELLTRAVDRGVIFSEDNLPTTLKGYDAEGNEKQIYGLYIEIPTDKDLTGIGDGLGFSQDGISWVYDPEQDVDVEELPSYIDQLEEKIGYRQLQTGHKGLDVKFINLYLGIDSVENENYSRETEQGVTYLQERLGIPQTGKVDWYTWQSVLPRKTFRLSAGYAGPKVRALQSGLRCLGYNTPVTSRFGTETIRAVREFQEANNLRVTGRVGLQEWVVLFDYR